MRLPAVLAVLLLLACSGGSPSPPPRPELTVLAAASLAPVLPEIVSAYEAAHGLRITTAFEASNSLRRRIEQGAPGDLFLSADRREPRALEAAGLAAPAADYARNRLVIVARPGVVADVFDLARPGLRLVAASPAVPAGAYADELVQGLARAPGAPAGFAADVAANILSREADVRGVLARVVLGEADAGFVYSSDAYERRQLEVLPIPTGVVEPEVVYAGVVLLGSAHHGQAEALLRALREPAAQAVFVRHGFLPLVDQ
ncbi:MAG TPA: molybdate ABC transporter substrate-binding protein [Candidatus Limnocylindrales bacterium]|nr:molybdate ABC transporter substrate-binding protein [Candidatus Limnocylindrales bacterium]